MLSTTTEYALRALTALARVEPGKTLLGRELAELTEVPANYLSKLLLELKKRGVVDAVRGTGGGYRLRREADRIPLIEVVEIFDAPRARPRCLLAGRRDCTDDNPCSAHEGWRIVRAAYVSFLEGTSVADIARHRRGDRDLI